MKKLNKLFSGSFADSIAILRLIIKLKAQHVVVTLLVQRVLLMYLIYLSIVFIFYSVFLFNILINFKKYKYCMHFFKLII